MFSFCKEMIIVKTENFHRDFLYNLADLTIFKNEYLESIQKWDRQKILNNIGYGNQPSRNVKFFGSYFEKKMGSTITDIDVILLVNNVNDDRLYQRLPQILKNLARTHFKFVRFYCGYIIGLEPVWKIGEEGDCDFNIDKINKWLENIKKNHPNIYEKVKPYLVKKTISMMDFIKADKAIEPYISLTWTREEIIQGYKIHNGIRYDFRQTMINYKRYRVMKFLYEYNNSYCLVDLNFVSRDKSIPRGSKDSVSYYIEDVYQMYKYLKKMLEPEKILSYIEDRKKEIGHITPLTAFVELINRLKKYNIVPEKRIQDLERFAKAYAKENKIDTIDYDKLQEIILEKITPLYDKYKAFVKEEFKPTIFLFSVRKRQLNIQVPIKVIQEREKLGYDCTLFPINVKHIEYIYKKAKDLLIDPYTLYDCIEKSSRDSTLPMPWIIENIFRPENYRIIEKDAKYILYLEKDEVKVSSNLKKLQKIALVK